MASEGHLKDHVQSFLVYAVIFVQDYAHVPQHSKKHGAGSEEFVLMQVVSAAVHGFLFTP